MTSYFRTKKEMISSYLKQFFDLKSVELSHINGMGRDFCHRLYRFIVEGKMLRGALVSLAHSLYQDSVPREEDDARAAVEAGAAVELIQSALLVHDDIMDRDEMRRTRKSVFYQYVEKAEREGIADPYHLGESLGICAGDILFFLAFEILTKLRISAQTRIEIQRLFTQELSNVGVAQMLDVYWGASSKPIGEHKILKLYLYKTGRYTFSLPLMTGAILAGAPQSVVSALEKIGEYMGIIFQLKDDELGLFGREAETGKPVGSDIKEGKKTLLYAQLLRNASEKNRSRFEKIFGNRSLNESDLDYVRKQAIESGVKGEIDRMAEDMARKARTLIQSLQDVQEESQHILLDLLDFSLERIR